MKFTKENTKLKPIFQEDETKTFNLNKELLSFYHDILDKIPLELSQEQANIILHYALSIGKKDFFSSLFYQKLKKIDQNELPSLLDQNLLSCSIFQ